MNKLFLIIMMIFMYVGCNNPPQQEVPQNATVSPTASPSVPVTVAPTATSVPTLVIVPTVVSAKPNIEDIKTIASNSSCIRYSWKERGRAPKGYIKGVSLVYAKALCNQTRGDIKLVLQKPTGNEIKDALAWYSKIFSDLKMDNENSLDILRHSYTLLIGLGMRESSGKYCCGRDMSANYSTADSAEAGLFQASWGARRVSTELVTLYNSYQKREGCFLGTFQEGVNPCNATNMQNWGTGEGVEWQELTKACPAFATEYAAVLIRLTGGNKGEFGPLRKQAAEVRPECDEMLKQIQDKVLTTPGFCDVINGHK